MKVLGLIILGFLCNGCTSLHLVPEAKDEEQLSCEVEAKPKSLQFLEQQYRCTSKP